MGTDSARMLQNLSSFFYYPVIAKLGINFILPQLLNLLLALFLSLFPLLFLP